MNTLNTQREDLKYVERVVESWYDWRVDVIECGKEYDDTEIDKINLLLNDETFSNWKQIYTVVKEEGVELEDGYWEMLNVFETDKNRIVLDEYFDNTIILYPNTKGLLVCETYRDNEREVTTSFRISLYKYDEPSINKTIERQIKVIERRFKKRYEKRFDPVEIEIEFEECVGYRLYLSLGINYIINGSTDGTPYKTLEELMGYEEVGYDDAITYYDSELDYITNKEDKRDNREEKMLMKSLQTFFRNAGKYVEDN